MIWIIVLGLATISLLLYYYGTTTYNYWTKRGVKQKKQVMFLGDNYGTVLRRENFVDMTLRVYKDFPEARYSGMYQMRVPTLVIKDIELIKKITVKDFDHFVDHRNIVDVKTDKLWGRNLFSLNGQQWREMRAVMSGSFTSSKMRQMFSLMTDVAKMFPQHFKNQNKDYIEIDMKDYSTRFTNDVIATSAFGLKVDSLENKTNEFYLMGKDVTNFTSLFRYLRFFAYMLMPGFFKFFQISIFPSVVTNFFKDLIYETVRVREEKGIVRPDMINILLEARKGIKTDDDHGIIDSGFAVAQESSMHKSPKQIKNITNDDIVAQALIFFFAGFETASVLMCFAAIELALNDDVQRKLRKEIMKTHKECEGKITYEALLNMKYLDMVLSETLRKWPPAIALDRVVTKPYTINPVTSDEPTLYLDKGDLIMIPVVAIHRDPKYYPNPEKFDPERFSDENKDNINPYTFLPFGIGPRNCIGSRFALLETKVLMYYILLDFELVSTSNMQLPIKLSKKSFNLMMEGGFKIGLKRLS